MANNIKLILFTLDELDLQIRKLEKKSRKKFSLLMTPIEQNETIE